MLTNKNLKVLTVQGVFLSRLWRFCWLLILFVLTFVIFSPHAFAVIKEMPVACANMENKLSQFVEQTVHTTLKDTAQHYSKAVAEVILNEGARYGFDPILLIALIQNESSFFAKRRGRHGEIGLMQVKPATARWISKEMGLPWNGSESLTDPVYNIRMGTAYLAKLSDQFKENPRLFLSAYNMGPFNVQKILKRKISPIDYANRVANHYLNFYTKFLESCNSPLRSQMLIAARDSLTVL